MSYCTLHQMTRLFLLLALVCSSISAQNVNITVGTIKDILCEVEQLMESTPGLNAGSGSIKIVEEALDATLNCLDQSGFSTAGVLRDCLAITDQNAPGSQTLFCTRIQQCNVTDIGVQIPNPAVFASCIATQGLGSLGTTIAGQLENVFGGVVKTAANPVKEVGQAVGGVVGTMGSIGGTLGKAMGGLVPGGR